MPKPYGRCHQQRQQTVGLLTGSVADARRKIADQLQLLRTEANSTAERSIEETAARYSSTRTLLTGLVGAANRHGLSIAGWIAISISCGLTRAVATANAASAGDLTQDVLATGNEEITDLCRANMAWIDAVSNVVLNTLRTMRSAYHPKSGELPSSSEQMSQGATERVSATEGASASMEEMASSVKQNADNASQTEAMAQQSATDAEASGVTQRCLPRGTDDSCDEQALL